MDLEIPDATNLSVKSVQHAIENLVAQERYMNAYAFVYIMDTLTSLRTRLEKIEAVPKKWLPLAEKSVFVLQDNYGMEFFVSSKKADTKTTRDIDAAKRFTLEQARGAVKDEAKRRGNKWQVGLLPERLR